MRKKKILFPIGTLVRVKSDEGREPIGYGHHPRDVGRVAKVKEYIKGTDYPYVLEGHLYSYWHGQLEKVVEKDEPVEKTEPCDCGICDPKSPFSYKPSMEIIDFMESITKPQEEEITMEAPKQTLRQKLRYAALPKDEKILRESGFYDSTGALTEQGRRIVVDMLWDTLGADDRKKVVEAVEATLPKE